MSGPNVLRGMLGAGLVGFLGYMLYAAVTWLRFGRPARSTERDPCTRLLDQCMPSYEVREVHETRVAAPAEMTMSAARDVDINRSRLVSTLMGIRTIPYRLRGHNETVPPRSLLDETLSLGWRVLGEVPERYVILGAVTQPWEPVVRFRGLSPGAFASFSTPGFAKIVWTLSVEPRVPYASMFRTETRVQTTDADSRERFRRYWSFVSPGVMLIRFEALRLVKAEAERRARLV